MEILILSDNNLDFINNTNIKIFADKVIDPMSI